MRCVRRSLIDDNRSHDRNLATIKTKALHVPAGEFKATGLALLDQVSKNGRPLIVTKRGKPVAKVISLRASGKVISCFTTADA